MLEKTKTKRRVGGSEERFVDQLEPKQQLEGGERWENVPLSPNYHVGTMLFVIAPGTCRHETKGVEVLDSALALLIHNPPLFWKNGELTDSMLLEIPRVCRYIVWPSVLGVESFELFDTGLVVGETSKGRRVG